MNKRLKSDDSGGKTQPSFLFILADDWGRLPHYIVLYKQPPCVKCGNKLSLFFFLIEIATQAKKLAASLQP